MVFLITYTIRDVQYTTDPSGDSPMVGNYVSVIGKVSAIYPDMRGFFIQDGMCGWCGIFVYAGSSMPSVSLWDSLEVSGVVQEYRNMTEIVLNSINILGVGSPINPLIITTGDVAESLEGVLVKVYGKVKDHWINMFGDYILGDGYGNIKVLNSSRYEYMAFLGDSVGVSGPLIQKFSEFYLYPFSGESIEVIRGINYTAYFNKSTDTTIARFIKNPGNDTLRFVVANFIGKARYNIDVAIYNISSQVIVDSLISARNRGLKVRVIYESDNYNLYIQQLEMAGIPTYNDSGRVDDGIMHMKVVAIDNRDSDTTNDVVLVGSYNFTTFADTLQVNSLVAIRSPGVGRNFLLEFNEMWGDTGDYPNPSNSRFGTQKVRNTRNVLSGDSISVWFLPEDTALGAFTSFIRGTSVQIHFGINIFTNNNIMYAFRDIHFSGKLVAGIFDWSDWNNPYSKSYEMSGRGGSAPWSPPARVIPYLPSLTFHDKFAIRDREAVEFGSANWSYNSFTKNDEVIFIIYSKLLADQFFQYWYRRWEEADTTQPPLGVSYTRSHNAVCENPRVYSISGREVKEIKAKGIYFEVCDRVVRKMIRL